MFTPTAGLVVPSKKKDIAIEYKNNRVDLSQNKVDNR